MYPLAVADQAHFMTLSKLLGDRKFLLMNMSPHELELMLFINKNFLSPSNFDKVMYWAHSATAKGYKFDSPSYSTLKKQINYTFSNTINGAALKS